MLTNMGTVSSKSTFDPARAEAFAGRMLQVLNDGALCLMASIGHRTGLFDCLRDQPPLASEEIASRAGLNERYVREWLGAMVTSRVITVDAETQRYQLPSEHAAYLTRTAGADNLAVLAQYISVLGNVEDEIVECFKNGGGVPYESYARFHQVMAEDSGLAVLPYLDSHILPLVPGLVERLEQGLSVLDAGCGSGRVLNRMAELFPNSNFVGMDLSAEAITAGGSDAAKRQLRNVEFIQIDLSNFDETAERDSFDLITTFDAVHDQGQPLKLLKGIYRALKGNGVYLMQDIKGSSHVHKNIDHPTGTFLYTASCLHCMTVSLAQGGEGLGAMWGEEKTREYLRRAGFSSVKTHQLEHDINNNWYVVRK